MSHLYIVHVVMGMLIVLPSDRCHSVKPGRFTVEVLAFEEAVDRSHLSDRVKSCGRACRDRLVQLVKHEQSRRDSFVLEEKPNPGGQLNMASSSVS